jgi:Phosphodiester glycosidase
VQVRLDSGGAVGPNQPVEGVVTVQRPSGGTELPTGHVVLTGIGTAGGTITRDLVLGTRVRIEAVIPAFPIGASAVGGGPLLVDAQASVPDAGEGFTSGQMTQRTSRTAVGQTADGSILLVTVAGPGQGQRGVTVPEQAELMKGLGSRLSVAMDAGGSAQMIAGGQQTVFWASPRSITTAVALSYQGVRIGPLPFRITPNADGIDDATTVAVTTPTPGRLVVRVVKRTGNAVRELVNEPVAAGTRTVTVDPRALKLGDGPFKVISDFTPDQGVATSAERELLIDRTLAALNVRAFSRKVGRARRPALGISFRLIRPARATVRVVDAAGVLRRTLVSGKRYPRGLVVLEWNRKLGRESADGAYRIEVAAQTEFGQPGLGESVTLKPPPKPRPRPRPSP